MGGPVPLGAAATLDVPATLDAQCDLSWETGLTMTIPGNGTTKRIIAGIVVGVALLLVGMVLSSERRISVLEARMLTFERAQEVNRLENREEHRLISDKLDVIQREVAGK